MPHPFHYVYILRSESDPTRHYFGLTSHLLRRARAHNAGRSTHTSKYRPWVIETAVAFRSKETAAAFEKYMKSGSGRAFATRRF